LLFVASPSWSARGVLATLEVDANCFGGSIESATSLLALFDLLDCLADYAPTLTRVSAAVMMEDRARFRAPGLAPVFPHPCPLSLTILGDITEHVDELLDALCASADRFPALVEMRIALVATALALLSLPRPKVSRRTAADD